MPIFDFQCSKCEHTHEVIAGYDEKERSCPKCGGVAKRIISVNGAFTANDDAPWIRTVLEVVDKKSTAPHVLEFRKDPTRQNYQKWMKGEGLRHMEPGEETARKPEPPDMTRVDKEVWEKHRARNKLYVGGR